MRGHTTLHPVGGIQGGKRNGKPSCYKSLPVAVTHALRERAASRGLRFDIQLYPSSKENTFDVMGRKFIVGRGGRSTDPGYFAAALRGYPEIWPTVLRETEPDEMVDTFEKMLSEKYLVIQKFAISMLEYVIQYASEKRWRKIAMKLLGHHYHLPAASYREALDFLKNKLNSGDLLDFYRDLLSSEELPQWGYQMVLPGLNGMAPRYIAEIFRNILDRKRMSEASYTTTIEKISGFPETVAAEIVETVLRDLGIDKRHHLTIIQRMIGRKILELNRVVEIFTQLMVRREIPSYTHIPILHFLHDRNHSQFEWALRQALRNFDDLEQYRDILRRFPRETEGLLTESADDSASFSLHSTVERLRGGHQVRNFAMNIGGRVWLAEDIIQEFMRHPAFRRLALKRQVDGVADDPFVMVKPFLTYDEAEKIWSEAQRTGRTAAATKKRTLGLK